MMPDFNQYGPAGGNIIGADNQAHNIVDLMGGGTPVNDRQYDISQYAPHGGAIIGSDNRMYDLVQLIMSGGSGGGGGGGITIVENRPATGINGMVYVTNDEIWKYVGEEWILVARLNATVTDGTTEYGIMNSVVNGHWAVKLIQKTA